MDSYIPLQLIRLKDLTERRYFEIRNLIEWYLYMLIMIHLENIHVKLFPPIWKIHPYPENYFTGTHFYTTQTSISLSPKLHLKSAL